MAEFKDRLKELRLACGLSQQELAARLKMHAMTISGYERGVRRPDFETLDRLADMLNANMDYLLGASEVNTGYPRYNYTVEYPVDEHERLERYFKDTHARRMFDQHFTSPTSVSMPFNVMRAYQAASPEIQLAVRKLLDLEEDNNGDR